MKKWSIVVVFLIHSLSGPAAEIKLEEARVSVTLPDSWSQIAAKEPGILVRAQADEGRVRFVLSKPPVKTKPERLDTAKYQQGVKDALRDKGFSKVVRSEVVKVAGADAYLCEAMRADKPYSILQVVWYHEDVPHSLVFLSLSKPFKELPETQEIMQSVKRLPRQ